MRSKPTEMITSLQNDRIKSAVRLRERREREKTDLFLIEGFRELTRAVDAGRVIETLFYCSELFLGENEQALMDRSSARLIRCSRNVFEKLSYRDRPDGLLAIAPQKHILLKELRLSEKPFLLIAESIEKPGNLGTILRSCDAAGVDAVIVCDPTTDIHNPNVVRSSVGTLFTLPVIEASQEETFSWLRASQIALAAATPDASIEFTQADFNQGIALAVGTEQLGLSQQWLDQADLLVRIPMLGKADSLNVASATTLLLYETVRQRRLLR